jgi:N-acetylneuraminic acid mutarotase
MNRSTRWMALSLCLAAPALLLAASKVPVPAPTVPTAPRPAAQLAGLAAELSAQFPTLAGQLAHEASFKTSSLTVNGKGFVGLEGTAITPAPNPNAMAMRARDRMRPQPPTLGTAAPSEPSLRVLFPQCYSDGFVASGGGVRVVLKPVGASDAQAAENGGRLLYRDAYPFTDSLHVVQGHRSEEILYLRSPQAPTRFDYLITDMENVKSVTVINGVVKFVGENGKGLVIPRPTVVDASGKRSNLAARWELRPKPRTSNTTWGLSLLLKSEGLMWPMVIDPGWSLVIHMATAREYANAVLLQTGEVLFVGGTDGTNALSTWEIYDPEHNVWNATGELGLGLQSSTATLLRDGRVLIVGGVGSEFTATATSIIFDPITHDVVPSLHQLNHERSQHTATLLQNGKVLVAGGTGLSGDQLKSTELFDPDDPTQTWISTDDLNMTIERANHTATLLKGGKVLVVGGDSKSVSGLNSAEVFNPNYELEHTQAWTQVGSLVSEGGRSNHAATLLSDGHVLVSGGLQGGSVLGTCQVYNPDLDNWTETGDMKQGRLWHTATLLPNSTILVVGGTEDGTNGLDSAEVYSGGSWKDGATLNEGRFSHSALMLPTTDILAVPTSQVLVAGGYGCTGHAPGPECSSFGCLSSIETLSLPTLTYDTDREPSILTVKCSTGGSSPFCESDKLVIEGSNFQGISEASGGNGCQNSSTNYPLVQLETAPGGVKSYLAVDSSPTGGWSEGDFHSVSLKDVAPGSYKLKVIASGIPSAEQAIEIKSAPQVFNLTGGGSYCGGGAGMPIDLSGSQTGVSYQLYRGAMSMGSPLSGTGSPLSFGNQAAGIYTVVATNGTSLCTTTMEGSVTVTELACARSVPQSVTPTTVTTADQGTSVTATWDSTNCPSLGYHIIYGRGEDLASLDTNSPTVEGGVCSIGTSGSYLWTGVPDPSGYTSGFLWFLVVGDSGTSIEGSWGLTSAGTEEGGTASSGLCGLSTKYTAGICATP